MNKEQLIEEMLNEVKSLKDLAKEEMPLMVKEYIFANKVRGVFGLCSGLLLLAASICSIAYGHEESGRITGTQMVCLLTGSLGLLGAIIMVFGYTYELIDFYLQPRRMAVKAITELIP